VSVLCSKYFIDFDLDSFIEMNEISGCNSFFLLIIDAYSRKLNPFVIKGHQKPLLTVVEKVSLEFWICIDFMFLSYFFYF
jgi:hypothetical protein